MTCAERFLIRTIVFEDGERMPLLVSADSGLPVFDACIYATSEIRPASGSAATIEQALRGVRLVLTFASHPDIDLHLRFQSAQFLDMHELDELVRAAYRDLSPKGIAEAAFVSPKILSLERARQRAPRAKGEPEVAIGTASIRLHYARTYLEWLGRRMAANVCKTFEEKQTYMSMLQDFLSLLITRTPNARSQSNRQSLSKVEREFLLRVIAPTSVDNPWTGEFVRYRNHLLLLWGLGT